jgi:hypothetical protein
MNGKKILLGLLVLGSIVVNAQTFTYNYTDPCTGILNSVTLSQTSGSVIMFYAGQYQTFTAAQLQAGGYEAWVAQINAQFPPGSNPCAGNGSSNANNSNANIGTNTANSVSGIVSISTSIAGSLGGGSVNTGSISTNTNNGSSSSSGSGSNNSNNGNGSNSSSNGSSSGSSGNSGSSGSSGGSSSGSGSGNTGGSGSSSGGSSGSSGGGNSGRPDSGGGTSNPSSGQSGTDGGGTSNTSTSNDGASSSGGTSDNTTTASGGESENSSGDSGGGGGGKPKSKQEKIARGSLIGSGDFVIIRNGNDISKRNDNVRFNASVTHVNTKQNFIKGVNLNYTTGENLANLTFYGSYKKKEFMAVGSNSFMTNFKSDWFNTVTLLSAQKLWKFTFMGGANFTLGEIGKSHFQNLSVVGGTFTTFKGGKSLSANVMALGVYSPYIFYYEGQWYKSGFLIVPLANVDFKLTDKFKWSISFSGAYQYNADILNFQLSTGTKMLL